MTELIQSPKNDDFEDRICRVFVNIDSLLMGGRYKFTDEFWDALFHAQALAVEKEKRAKEFRPKPPSIAPFENLDDTNSDYFANFLVPAFTKTFGREKSRAFSYHMSEDHTCMLFDVNETTLFVQQEFFTKEFRECLKKAFLIEPVKIDIKFQMKMQFQFDEEIVGILESSYRVSLLRQVFHVLGREVLQAYPVPDEEDGWVDRPLLITDAHGHAIGLRPVVVKEEEELKARPAIENPPESAPGVVSSDEVASPTEQRDEPQDVETNDVPLSEVQEESNPQSEAVANRDSLIERHKQIIELQERGKSYRQIARKVKFSKSLVALELRRHRQSACSCYAQVM